MAEDHAPGPARRPLFAAVGVAFLIIVAALGAGWQLQRAVSDDVETREHEELDGVVSVLERRMRVYSEATQSAASLWSTLGDPGRDVYWNFAESLRLEDRYPGFQVIGHASRVMGAELDAWSAVVDADAAASGLGYPPFELRTSGTPEADTEMVIIDAVYPVEGNRAAFGLDFLGEPNRRDAVLRARDTGQPAATGPVTLVQETASQRAFLIMVPAYEGPVSDDLGRRRAAFNGVSYAAFRMNDLVESMVAFLPSTGAVRIHDAGLATDAPEPVTVDGLMYEDERIADDAVAPVTEYVDVAGRWWLVEYWPVGATPSVLERFAPLGAILLGLVFALLAGWLVRSILTSRERAVALAAEMTAELEENRQELARSNEELERFAYVASHDLQEPLRTIGNYLGMLERREQERLDERSQQYLRVSLDGAARLSLMIRELLDFSRAGRERELTNVDLDVAWATAVGGLRAAIEQRGAEIECDPLPAVVGDADALVQVLQNLVENALKYGDPERPVIDCTAEVRGDRCDVIVSDNGIGIAPEHHEEIFEMLRRLHTRDEYPGTGMGLAIVRRLVEAMGGTITVRSELGAGASFVVSLPLAPTEGRRPAVPPAPPVSEPRPLEVGG